MRGVQGVRRVRGMRRHRSRAGAVALAVGAGGVLLGACAPSGPTAAPGTAAGSGGAGTSAAAAGHHHATPPPSSTTTSSTATTTTTTTVPPQPGWTVLASEPTGVAVDARTFSEPDGSSVRVIRFRAGQVAFHLHAGATDPPSGGVPLPAIASYKIAPTEAPGLLAAFNGGFKVTAHAGGVEVDGHVLTPLVPGLASLVIDASGRATIDIWGGPGSSAGVGTGGGVSVRQNLPPLVAQGAPTAAASTWQAWGATLGGGPYVARSALGEDGSGDLLYAASMSTVPIDLADALVASGAQIGMELDINPEWVQADVAPVPGAPLVAQVPGQNRPADQYQAGWTRDFVAVVAR